VAESQTIFSTHSFSSSHYVTNFRGNCGVSKHVACTENIKTEACDMQVFLTSLGSMKITVRRKWERLWRALVAVSVQNKPRVLSTCVSDSRVGDHSSIPPEAIKLSGRLEVKSPPVIVTELHPNHPNIDYRCITQANKWTGCDVVFNITYRGVPECHGWVVSTPLFHILKILSSITVADTKYPDD
jgi:hypothetical protein